MKYVAGEVIFKEGDVSDMAYLVEHGRVEIYRTDVTGMRHPIAMLDAGQMFGEMGVLDDAPRSASARALTDVTLRMVEIDRD